MNEINRNTLVDKADLLQYAAKYYGVAPNRVRMELKTVDYWLSPGFSSDFPLFYTISSGVFANGAFGRGTVLASLSYKGNVVLPCAVRNGVSGVGSWGFSRLVRFFDSVSAAPSFSASDPVRVTLFGYEFTIT